MLLNRRKQLTHIDTRSDKFDQTVELSAAFFTVDATVRMRIKNAIHEFL